MIDIQEIVTSFDPTKHYTVKEVSEITGLSKQGILNAITRNDIESTKILNKYYISGKDFRDYLLGEKKKK